ncbi:Ig-like domain-containing protein, partial [Erwinia sp. B116]|uniref:Ig-like domain-containing protein n=1 Tax=Erwinia sp. B116 TaxID=1561024 RepID=UPI000CB5499D
GQGLVSSDNFAIDTQLPTATIQLSDTALRAGETSVVTITFSEAVSGLTREALSAPNGTLSELITTDGGITWTGTYTPNADVTDATNQLVLNQTWVRDAAGNIGQGLVESDNFAIDTKLPTATIQLSDTALKAGEASTVTITFSEAVSGLTREALS